MKLCTHCNAQFEANESRCLHCGRPLQDAPGVLGAPIPDAALLTRREPIFAVPVLEALREAGIPFELDPDGAAHLVAAGTGSSGPMARIEIFVPAERLEEAQELEDRILARELPDLSEEYYEYGEDREDDGTCCPACGHPIGPSDAECASCGLGFPDADS